MEVDALAKTLAVPELPALLAAVDARVREALGSGNLSLAAAASRVAEGGGKRLRPVLTMAFAELGDGYNRDAAVAGAAAVELVQIGSLVHDDMFDRALTRRGVPTINAVEGESVALVAGDFILARAAEQALLVDTDFAGLLAKTMTWLCEGQLLELRDQFNIDRSVENYLESIRAKTAVLFAAAAAAGARCADMSNGDVAAAMAFGSEFGMAYQLVDDVLDFIADPARLGKPTGVDLETGVYTLPVLLQLGKGASVMAGLLKVPTKEHLAAVRELVIGADTIGETLAMSARHSEKASSQMCAFSGPVARGLSAFPRTYFAWALEHFVP